MKNNKEVWIRKLITSILFFGGVFSFYFDIIDLRFFSLPNEFKETIWGALIIFVGTIIFLRAMIIGQENKADILIHWIAWLLVISGLVWVVWLYDFKLKSPLKNIVYDCICIWLGGMIYLSTLVKVKEERQKGNKKEDASLHQK